MPDTTPQPPPRRRGLIDIHSHLIPGVDDGCQSIDESLHAVRLLQAAGFVGTVCTPHLWPSLFPQNTPRNIENWAQALRTRLGDEGIDYQLWHGGELRLFDGVTGWMDDVGVPTLAGSRLVLCDFWEPRWARWVDDAFAWLLDRGYTPLLAHPERLSIPTGLPQKLAEWAGRGVLLQGNYRCFTGEDGLVADQQVRDWMTEGRYTFLAMDTHRPDTIPARVDGLRMVEAEHGRDAVERLTIANVRRLVFNLPD